MNRQNNRQNNLHQNSSIHQSVRLIQAVRRRQLPPFLFRMRPVTLSMCSVLLISFMAILYVSQLGQAVTTNQQIQDQHTQQAVLQRQNNDLENMVSQEQSPAYIAARAAAMGLVPVDQQNTRVAVVLHSTTQANREQSNQP
ncbi:MAG: septum formation initiator family protein [Ktedonobacteraceae bacterium]